MDKSTVITPSMFNRKVALHVGNDFVTRSLTEEMAGKRFVENFITIFYSTTIQTVFQSSFTQHTVRIFLARIIYFEFLQQVT